MSLPPRSARFAALVAQQPENELFRFSLAQALDSGFAVTIDAALARDGRCTLG